MVTTSTTPVTAESLIANIAEIGPILQENAAQGERERRLPQASFDALKRAGLLRLGKPSAFGGQELDPVSLMKVVEETACYDCAAGWNVQISCAVHLVLGWFPDEGATEVLGLDPDASSAGTFFPPGNAVPVDGGFRLSGRWPFASGCQQTTWCFGPAFVMDGDSPQMNGDGTPAQMLVFHRTADVEILDTWHTLGMRGTGSHDVVAKDVFVPDSRTVPFGPVEQMGRAFQHPTYRMAMWVAVALLAPPALGVARSALADLVELAKNKTPHFTTTTLRDRSVVQSNVAKAQATLDSARCYLFDCLNQGFESVSSGDPLPLEQKGKIQLATSYAIRSAADALDLICEAAGTSAIRLEKPFERHFRDIHTMTQHAAGSTARYESVGKLMFGLESDWPFFAF